MTYYRDRVLRADQNMREGIIDPIDAKAMIEHDLAWALYHSARSKGRRVSEPSIRIEDSVDMLQAAAEAAATEAGIDDSLDALLDDEDDID